MWRAVLVTVAFALSLPAAAEEIWTIVDLPDLQVVPQRFAGKKIEVRGFACYHADLADYRCFSLDGKLTVSTRNLSTNAAKERFIQNCKTLRAVRTSSRCDFVLRFEFPRSAIHQEIAAGSLKHTFLYPYEVELLPLVKRRR